MKGKIFNAQEVQSMIAGNKTQFREVIKPQPNYQVNVDVRCGNEIIIASVDHPKEVFCLPKCPYKVGQKIFCKESWVLVEDHLDYETGGEWSVREWEGPLEEAQAHLNGDARFGLKASVYYPADGEDENPAEMHDTIGIGGKLLSKKEIPWRSARSMPQWASRLTLLIKEIRVEKLSEISEEDAIAEGIYWEHNLGWTCGNEEGNSESAIAEFVDLWNATHKKPEEKFEASPFCWVIDFEVVK